MKRCEPESHTVRSKSDKMLCVQTQLYWGTQFVRVATNECFRPRKDGRKSHPREFSGPELHPGKENQSSVLSRPFPFQQ